MPGQSSKRSSLIEFALIFAIIYLVTQLIFRVFFPQPTNGQNGAGNVIIKPASARIKGDHSVMLTLKNSMTGTLVLPARCPLPPVDVFRVEGGSGGALVPLTTTETALPCVPLTEVAPHGQAQVDLGPWKYSLLSAMGSYEVRLPAGAKIVAGSGGTKVEQPLPPVTARFSLYEPGPLTRLFRAFITKPFLNFLIFITSLLPDHNLGIAIIVLTIVVKLLLFIPTQHALEGQRRMQKAQPHLDEIRKRYKDDPKKMQEETMKAWKEHGVNPFQSCLPMLVQFPVLIGLFYVIRDGSVLALSQHLIYSFYQHLDWTFNTSFLGLDLLKPSYYIFPPLLVLLQFLQMKLSFSIIARKKKAEQGNKMVNEMEKTQQVQQRMMLYGLPLMIGFFAFQFPTAVSLYWGISTLFAIGQQWVVNRKV
ncbi:MAG: YidC/Oxa1 family membrane protein insertase [Candidatus Peribacteraceae bacterium]|nr:YidC/Oxa1 family membrane protein insertase [Candidatus Peribacteraceae bacterium]